MAEQTGPTSDGQPKLPDPLWRKVGAALAMMVIGVGTLIADYVIGLDICFNLLVAGLTIKALIEFYDMCESSRTGPFKGFGIVAAVILVILHWLSLPGTVGWFAEAFGSDRLGWAEENAVPGQNAVLLGLVVAVLGSLWLQATKRDNDRTFEAISTTLFGILYLWFLASFLVRLRHVGLDGTLGGPEWNYVGSGLLVSCLAVSKFSDIGAYLFGRKFGRHKMIPRISPNKTYEGLAAGLVLSVGVAFLLWEVGLLPLGPGGVSFRLTSAWWRVVLFGVLVGGMGTLGDLAESLLKRGSGRKDSGDLVPGFGGVLDVVDSLLLSAPVAYFLAVLLLRFGG